ncbi:PPC domain-containing DNA-binding protein [Thermodesulfobacteriota bacterium]
MKYCEARLGRVFVLRLEDGDIVHEVIKGFVKENSVNAAALIILGGAAGESRLVVGPEDGDARPVNPTLKVLKDVHEATGVGTVFADEKGNPVLHMHMACGRGEETTTGCIRSGVKVWQIMEVVLFELVDTEGVRVFDAELGFNVLQV